MPSSRRKPGSILIFSIRQKMGSGFRRNDEAGLFGSFRRSESARNHADRLARLRTLGLELDLAVDQREQRVVAAEADAGPRVEARAALANDDVAGFDRLAAVDLDAEVLRIRI